MLKRLVQICFVLVFVAANTTPLLAQDAAIIEAILTSLQGEAREVRFDPRPLKPDSRIHTLTSFAEFISEFEGQVEEPFLKEDAEQIEAARRQVAVGLGIRLTDHTQDDNCKGMLKPAKPGQVEFIYFGCPDSSYWSVIYSTARDVAPDWLPAYGVAPSKVKVVRGLELSLTPRGMFAQSMDYYVMLEDEGPRLIEQKRLIIME